MGVGMRLRNLWHLRTGVVLSLAVALVVGMWSVEQISLSRPGRRPARSRWRPPRPT